MTEGARAAQRMRAPLVILMAKAPRPGEVKTRLAADLGESRATALYRALVERQVSGIPAAWPWQLHFSPSGAEAEMRAWLGDAVEYRAQPAGDLGERLRHAFEGGFAAGYASVIAIGGDCPGLRAEDLRLAAEHLRRTDVVLGPAVDGGYYLVGTRFHAPGLFRDVPWSSPRVLEVTLRRIAEGGWSHHLLEPKEDIDDLASLERAGGAARFLPAGH